jgi:hypothetical protein
MNRYLLFCTLLFCCAVVNAQDTIKLGPSIFYSSTEYPDDRSFYRYAEYAREDVIHSPSVKEVQYCHYKDGNRRCLRNFYELVSDSILKIYQNVDDTSIEEWIYKKREDSVYEVHTFIDGLYYEGLAKSLQPLLFSGKVFTTTTDRIDTLWYAQYYYTARNPDGNPQYTLYKSKIAGKIYKAEKCETVPMISEEKAFDEIVWNSHGLGCYNDPYYTVLKFLCVITAEGRIKNVQLYGNLEWYCPEVDIDFYKTVYRNYALIPATRKGEAVNVEWLVKVKENE